MRRRTFLAYSVFSGVACSRRGPGSLRKLRIGAPLALGTAALYLGEELGYFREAGFETEITTFERVTEATTALAGGKLEVLLASHSPSWMNAIVRGVPIRVVAAREKMSPACRRMAFLAALKSMYPDGLGDLRVLKGKRIIVGGGTGTLQFALTQHLATAGLTLDDVVTVHLTGPDAMAALFSGSAEAMMVFDDSLLPDRRPELVFSRGFAELHPNYQYGLILFGAELRQEDPRTGRGFLKAYFRGVRDFVQGGTPKFLKEFADYRGVDAQRMELVCRDNYVMDGRIDPESLRLFAGWAFRRGYLTRQVEVSELIDPRFLVPSAA